LDDQLLVSKKSAAASQPIAGHARSLNAHDYGVTVRVTTAVCITCEFAPPATTLTGYVSGEGMGWNCRRIAAAASATAATLVAASAGIQPMSKSRTPQ
jgi:hypothetical protein